MPEEFFNDSNTFKLRSLIASASSSLCAIKTIAMPCDFKRRITPNNSSTSPGVNVAVYWTGGLAGQSQPGTSCEPMDWTCQGGSLVGIEAYAAAMSTPVLASTNTSHSPMDEPPEIREWLGLA